MALISVNKATNRPELLFNNFMEVEYFKQSLELALENFIPILMEEDENEMYEYLKAIVADVKGFLGT